MNNTFFPDTGNISARLHAFNESIRIRQVFDDVINNDSRLNTIFSNQDVNKETNVISKLIVMSLTTGKYRVGFAQATVNLKPVDATVSDSEYQEREYDTLEQACEFLMSNITEIPWFEKAVSTIKETLRHELLIDGLRYVINGECIGNEGSISLYHLFKGKWMWFNCLTGENVIAEDFDFKHGKVQSILVRAGMKLPVAVFTFE